MKAWKIVGKVFACIAAAILSIFLVIMLITTPIFGSVTSKSSIKAAAGEMLKESFNDGRDANDEMQKFVDELMNTKFVDDVIELIGENALTVENIKEKLGVNFDEVYDVLEKNNMIDQTKNKQEVKEALDSLIEAIPPEVLSGSTTKEDVAASAFSLAGVVVSRTALLIFIGICVALAGLVYLCTFPKCQGLIWLAVDMFISAAVLVPVAFGTGLAKTAIDAMMASSGSEAAALASAVIETMPKNCFIAIAVYVLLSAGAIVGFVFITKARKKKEAATEQHSTGIPYNGIPTI